MDNPFSLNGKTILVTGASSGIGKSIAVECSKMGANLIISARNKIRLNETFELLEGNNHQQYCADLTNMEDLRSLVQFLPKLDGFVSNAGIAKPQILQITEIPALPQFHLF